MSGGCGNGNNNFLRGQVSQDLETRESLLSVTRFYKHAKPCKILKCLSTRPTVICTTSVALSFYLTDVRHREPIYREMGEHLKGVFPCSTGIVVTALARPEWVVKLKPPPLSPHSGGGMRSLKFLAAQLNKTAKQSVKTAFAMPPELYTSEKWLALEQAQISPKNLALRRAGGCRAQRR